MKRIAIIPLILVLVLTAEAQQLAFPGAEGAGRYAVGGRGGQVIEVTNLSDCNTPGCGSFRAAVEAYGPRTVVFRVSGTIELQSSLTLVNPYITIAGQTAPGDGICIKNYRFRVIADHVIIRYMRFRLGDEGMIEQDCVWVEWGQDIIFDHCSTSWGRDETLSVANAYNTIDDVTIQWCMITEGLNYADHGYGSLIRGGNGNEISFHHNLFAHHKGRCPRPGNYIGHEDDPDGLFFDFRNNVIYNWRDYAGHNADRYSITKMNFIGNYYAQGINSYDAEAFWEKRSTYSRAYFSDNWMNDSRPIDQWSLVRFTGFDPCDIEAYKQSSPFPVTPIETDGAPTAYERVLADVGATFPARDSVDERIVNEVINRTGSIINSQDDVGGWPVLESTTPPNDIDQDGMPDYWELALCLNPSNPDDRNDDRDGDGYTNLEEYLNWLPTGEPMPPIFVDQDATGANNGSSWANAYNYLQDALAVVVPSRQIWVAAGIYEPDCSSTNPTGSNDREATFGLVNDVDIYGGFAGTETSLEQRDWKNNVTILSGDINAPGDINDNSYHVVTASGTDANTILDGFTITGGNANGTDPHNMGGGMYNNAGNPTVANCIFTNNSALNGGGINAYDSNMTVTNCTFTNNSSLTLVGGAGGVLTDSGSPEFVNCIFTGNFSADTGGGISIVDGTPILKNCLFSGNTAIADGGGMFNNQSSPTLTNCTFSKNSAGANGGGICSEGTSNPMVTNCILWANTAPGGPQINDYGPGSTTVNYSDIQGGWGGPGGNNKNSDPLFADPNGPDDTIGTEDDNLRLQYNSPCIDTGDNTAVSEVNDLDGKVRFVDGDFNNTTVVDMGAYEYWGPIYVDIDAPGPHDGSSWAKAYKYLQDGLAVVSAGHEIWVAEGTYKPDTNAANPNGTGERDVSFQLKSGAAVYGGYAGFGQPNPNVRNITVYQTILSGDLDGNDTPGLDPCDLLNDPSRGENSYHVVTTSNTDETTILDGFTITAGNANGSEPHNHGGGMYNSSGSPTVANCLFIQNGADEFGGGMKNQSSDPNIINCTFSGNSASNGGGMYNYDSSPTVTNCTIANNRARANQRTGLFADSESEFSDTQGQDNWYYGFYDGNGPDPYSSADFEELPLYDDEYDVWYIEDYWTLLWDDGGYPASYPGIHWAVRRWVSELTGKINITGRLRKYNDECGDGVTGHILVDGVEVWSQHIAYDDTAGVNFNINVDVNTGSLVDFAIDPNVDADCDDTFFAFIIQAFPLGSGIYCENNSNMTISNSILWGNTVDANEVEISLRNASRLKISYSDIQGGWLGTGNIGDDPMFVDADGPDDIAGTQDDNLRLSVDSNCIDAGDNTAVPADATDLDNDGSTIEPIPFDLNGFLRFIDSCTADTGNGTPPIVDIGAYEFFGSDICGDGEVNFNDFSRLALHWLDVDCGTCGGADLDCDGDVNWNDLKVFTDNWLAGK